MDDTDVDLLLRQIGLRATTEDNTRYDYPRDEMIDRLMNMTLQCLGALRQIVVEDEKIRISNDSCDIDGSQRDDGKAKRLKRKIFSGAVQNITHTIVQAQDLDPVDPMKDLIESYPWGPSLNESGWLSLSWLLIDGASVVSTPEETKDHIATMKIHMEKFPNSINEIDKKGQHYMYYAVRSNSLPLIESLIHENKSCVKFKDGSGMQAIHYSAAYSQSVEMLYTIVEAIGKPMDAVMSECLDDDGNLPIHCASGGCTTVEVVKEIVFASLESVRVANQEGKLAMHLAAGKNDLEIVKALFAAFPDAVSLADKTGWLPLYHGVFSSKSVEVIQFIHEAYREAINKPHYSGRLPIHYAAVTSLSSKVMKYLLDAYPDGASTLDTNRRLPIHNLVARCTYMTPVRLRCMRLLLEAYPYGAGMAGNDGRTPLDLARRDGQGPLVLRLLLRADPEQDPEALGEISYIASKAKYKRKKKNKEKKDDDDDGERA